MKREWRKVGVGLLTFLVVSGTDVEAKSWNDVSPEIRAKYFPAPSYPLDALAEGRSGRLEFRVLGSDRGTVREFIVIKSSGQPLIDQGVLHWVYQRWSFPKDPANKELLSIDMAVNFQATPETQEKAKILLAKPRPHLEYQPMMENGVRTANPFPRAPYPYEARKKKQQGTCIVRVLIDGEGRVAEAKVSKSSGYPLLDKSAVETIGTRWNFKGVAGLKPGYRDIPMRFELGNN